METEEVSERHTIHLSTVRPLCSYLKQVQATLRWPSTNWRAASNSLPRISAEPSIFSMLSSSRRPRFRYTTLSTSKNTPPHIQRAPGFRLIASEASSISKLAGQCYFYSAEGVHARRPGWRALPLVYLSPA